MFEGLITESDPVLAPDLQSGWVLAGSFLLNPLEMEEQFSDRDTRSGRITGGVTQGELTVDLYYQVLFEAEQQPGLAGFDYQDNNLEQDGRDLYGWFLPMTGKLGQTGWTSAWLQIWLMDPEGKMISHLPVKISPYGIEWKSGWFRLTFNNEQGESVHADGRIEVFSPESKLDDSNSSKWYSVASELSRQLMERDTTIGLLQNELTEVKLRLDGLRKMVDLLVDERASLQEDNKLLRERAEAADPEMIHKLAELTAEKSLLETRINDLSGENDSLLLKLDDSERERIDLLRKLADLEKQYLQQDVAEIVEQPAMESIDSLIPQSILMPPAPLPQPEVETDIRAGDAEPEPEPVVRYADVAEPVVVPVVEPVVEPVAPPAMSTPVAEEPVTQQQVQPEPDQQENEKRWISRRRGPRKFR